MIWTVLSMLSTLLGLALGSLGIKLPFLTCFFVLVFLVMSIHFYFGLDWLLEKIFLISLVLLCFYGGFLRSHAFVNLSESFQNESGGFYGQIKRVNLRANSQQVFLDLKDGQGNDEGRVLVIFGLYDDLAVGDLLFLEGHLEVVSNEDLDFDYKKFLAKDRVFRVMAFPNYEILDHFEFEPSRPFFSAWVYLSRFKLMMLTRLRDVIPEPASSLAAGLLLGSREGMPEQLSLAFSDTGLTHIVAVSGSNITLLVGFCFFLLSFLRLKWRVLFSLVFIFLFVALVGFGAAVIRAALMGCLTLWALYTGLRSQVYFVLLWTALLMALHSPFVLLYDLGFQLSFLSTFGILALNPVFEAGLSQLGFVFHQKMERSSLLWLFYESALMTLAAQLFTLPLVLYHFGSFHLLSPLVNVLVAPLLLLAMLFSFLALLFGPLLGFFAHFFLGLVIGLALFFSSLSSFIAKLPFNRFDFFFSYFLLFLLVLLFHKSALARVFAFGFSGGLLWLPVDRTQKHVIRPEHPF